MAGHQRLADIWQPRSVTDYKVHFARWNGKKEPANVLASSMDEWRTWQEYLPKNDPFNRRYIFSLAQVPDRKDHWMFGGIWRVNGRTDRPDGPRHYQVALEDDLRDRIGDLRLERSYPSRNPRVNLENHYDHFLIA